MDSAYFKGKKYAPTRRRSATTFVAPRVRSIFGGPSPNLFRDPKNSLSRDQQTFPVVFDKMVGKFGFAHVSLFLRMTSAFYPPSMSRWQKSKKNFFSTHFYTPLCRMCAVSGTCAPLHLGAPPGPLGPQAPAPVSSAKHLVITEEKILLPPIGPDMSDRLQRAHWMRRTASPGSTLEAAQGI